MPAYVIGQIRIVNQEKWEAYRAQVPATLAPWDGRVLFRGRTARVLTGNTGSPTWWSSSSPTRTPFAAGMIRRPTRP